MEDNKDLNKNPQADNQPKVGGSPLSEGKSKEDIKRETINLQKDFGAAGVDDINKNLGSFSNTVKQQEQAQSNEVKLDVDARVVEEASKEKIDFEKFNKTKRDFETPKTKFGEKVGLLLRNKKGLKTIWIVEIVSMFVIMTISIVIISCFTKYVGWTKEGPMVFPEFQACLKTGLVFHWISIFPCIVPLVYLLTTWFIGINEVYASKMYHYFFWIAGAISVLCFIVGIGVMIFPWSELAQWGGEKLLLLTILM